MKGEKERLRHVTTNVEERERERLKHSRYSVNALCCMPLTTNSSPHFNH